MLELLHDFFTDTDPAIRTHLGRFLIARQSDEDTSGPGIQTSILVNELRRPRTCCSASPATPATRRRTRGKATQKM
jgi:hypothetical protein